MEEKKEILELFGGRIRASLERAKLDFAAVREIRMRADRPMLFRTGRKELFLLEVGTLNEDADNAICPTMQEIKGVLECACGYSGYAFEKEIKNGYITIYGGHRIGLVGQAVMEQKEVKTLKYVSALNIRVAHSLVGNAELWKQYFYEEGSPCHMLIISPPGCGKTTFLRDVIRIYSEGNECGPPVTVGVADERSEIGATYRGKLIHPLGMRVDVLDGCPKAIGMEMLLRSMAPDVLAADEIGKDEIQAMEHGLRYGCKIIATLHGGCLKDYLEKPGFQGLVKEKLFQRYLFLKKGGQPGTVERIYDGEFRVLWEEGTCT